VKADRSAGKAATAEMGYCYRPADGSKAAGNEAAMPPSWSDRRES
jgi:hypothetical protein